MGQTASTISAEIIVAEPSFACGPLTNAAAVAGKVVVVDRGACTFDTKAKNAFKAGAAVIVVANNVAGEPPFEIAGDFSSVAVPVIGGVTLEVGNLLKELNGTVGVLHIGPTPIPLPVRPAPTHSDTHTMSRPLPGHKALRRVTPEG